MVLILCGIAIIIAALYFYYKTDTLYWKNRGISGPAPECFYGNWRQLDQFDFPAVLKLPQWTKLLMNLKGSAKLSNFQQYGKYFGIFEGLRKVLVISDVDMLQDLFVRKFEYFHGRKTFPMAPNPDTDPRVHVFAARGQRWKRLRTLANPSFSINSLKKMRAKVESSALVTLSFLAENADTGKSFNIHKIHDGCHQPDRYGTKRQQAIQKSLHGLNFTSDFNAALPFLQSFMRKIDSFWSTYLPSALPKSILPYYRNAMMHTASIRGSVIPKLFELVTKEVEDRKQIRAQLEKEGNELPDAEDFIDLFLDTEADVQIESTDEFDRQKIKVERKLGTQEVVAQCFVFLLAGFDTTANSLAYASFLLAKHPHIQDKVIEEIDSVCTRDDITYDDLGQLQYLDYVVKESLRLYPLGAFANSRICSKTTTLGDGTAIMADSWTIHHSKEIWGEDADEFVPERWEDDRPKHPLAWFPFGAGPRQCIGMRLALMEEKMLLAHILRKYNLFRGPDSEKELKLIGNFTVSPESVTVYLKTREK